MKVNKEKVICFPLKLFCPYESIFSGSITELSENT